MSQLKAQATSLDLSSIEDTPRILVNCLSCLLLSWKRFKWDVKKFEPHFSISPEEGYITAGMEVSFEVTYHPTEVGKESLYKNLLCFIQGGSPLSLTLSGVCVGPPAVKEVSRCCSQTGQQLERSRQAPQLETSDSFKQSSVPTPDIQTCSMAPATGLLHILFPLLQYSFSLFI